MSTVKFNQPSSSTASTNSSTSYTIPNEAGSLKTLSFSRDTSERLLYINYPESILSTYKCFANNTEGDKRIFQTTISANETVQLFFSHHNRSGSNLNYGILLYNPNSSSVTVSAPNFGYGLGWNYAEFEPWKQFYNGSSTSVNIPAGQSRFLLDWRDIPSSNKPFSGIMRITSPKEVILTVYMWHGTDTTVIDGNETQYSYNKTEAGNTYDKAPAQKYTGIGSGYYLTTSNTVKYTDISSGGGIYYKLAACDSNNTNEIIPIKLSGSTGLTAQKGASSPLNNLGNWGAQYQFTTTLDNKGNSSSKVFRCYIGRNSKEGKVFVKYGSTYGYCSMGLSTSTLGTAYKWHCFDVTVDANSTKTITFQFSHATCSSSPIYMQWRS